MGRSDNRTALTDEVARFQAEIQRLALAMARAAIERELDHRRAKPEPGRQRKGQPARPPTRTSERQVDPGLGLAPTPERQLELPLARQAEAEVARQAELPAETQRERQRTGAPEAQDAAAVPATPAQPPSAPTGARKRVAWTRETIVSELATWMLSGTAIDAPFMTRHGPPGLVAAIRRVFGRFEAALNVAALHVSKLYPDGPPTRRVS